MLLLQRIFVRCKYKSIRNFSLSQQDDECLEHLKRKIFVGRSFFKLAVTASMTSQLCDPKDFQEKLGQMQREVYERVNIDIYVETFLHKTTDRKVLSANLDADFEAAIKLKVSKMLNFRLQIIDSSQFRKM